MDDSNQIAIVPERGATYDKKTKKIMIDEQQKELQEKDDERVARILLDIANDVVPCIKMEADWPSKTKMGDSPYLT